MYSFTAALIDVELADLLVELYKVGYSFHDLLLFRNGSKWCDCKSRLLCSNWKP